MPIPAGLNAPGTQNMPFTPMLPVSDLPPGTMRRFSTGDLDLLMAHTASGICVSDDRCPHMSAPLSIGSLDGCVVACPLHRGRFDLESGETVQFPTTGGLDANGGYHPPWTPADTPAKIEPTDLKVAGARSNAGPTSALLPNPYRRRHGRGPTARVTTSPRHAGGWRVDAPPARVSRPGFPLERVP